tara:strand:- start:139 stop:1776 length:1638 start_codon:yes stop_codon:yes gene_type:complete
MKYSISFIIKVVSFLCITLIISACQEDYAEIGTDIINDQIINIQNQTYPIKTYNKRVLPFQSNTLPGHLIGHYFDPNFGSTTAHFLGQLTPGIFEPTFGDNTVLDSVVLTIPYFSKIEDETYSIDSLYGNGPIKLSIYKNDFFLRNFDPASDLDESQLYFSNGSMGNSESLNFNQLEGQLLYTNEEFIPSNQEIILVTRDDDGEILTSETLSPSLRIKLENNLPESFWETLIFEKEGSEELSSANNFYNYFRGLYFKAEQVNAESGSIFQMNFNSNDAHLKLYYTYETTSVTTNETTERQGVYDMRFGGNRTALFENSFNDVVQQSINNSNVNDGDSQLFLKGTEGSMAIIELFSEDENGNNFEDFITEFREIINEGEANEERIIKRLVNEAYLEFYIDDNALFTETDFPNRIYIYDLENDVPLIDYLQDPTVDPSSSDSKFYHLAPLSFETDENGNESGKYKIRLTEHINNLIVNDLTNLTLGLCIASNVSLTNTQKLLTYDETVKGIPATSILSPKGIVLHGNNTDNSLKKPKFKIYYSQPNN